MKKIWIVGLLTLALLLAGAAFADQEDAPVLLVQLPEDAQMVENVAFDDGDFIQTYQLSGGAYVQLLRYMQSDVTIDGLVAGGDERAGAGFENRRRLRGAGRFDERCAGRRRGASRGAGARFGGSLCAGVSGGLSAEAGHGSD